MKKRIIFGFFIFVSLLLVSCDKSLKKLDTPNVILTGDVVSWDSVKNANHYLLYIDEKLVTVNQTSYDLINENLEAGTYQIYVVAVKGDVISQKSNLVNYIKVAEKRLDAPIIRLNEDTLSWQAIEGANYYLVYIGKEEIMFNGTSYDLANSNLEPGLYSVSVATVKGDDISLKSNLVEYVVTEKQLNSPSIKLRGNILSWNTVFNADSYLVTINDLEVIVQNTSYDLTKQLLDPGTYVIKVIAVKEDNHSFESNEVRYYIEDVVNVNYMTEEVLKKYDSNYIVGMQEEDFTEIVDYEDYLEAFNKASLYAFAADGVIISPEVALNLFNDLYDFYSLEPDFSDLNNILTIIDILVSNEITADVAANLIIKIFSSENLFLPDEIKTMVMDYSSLTNDSLEIIFNYVYEMRGFLSPDFIALLNKIIKGDEINLSLEEIVIIKNTIVTDLLNTLLLPEEFETLSQLTWIVWAVFNDKEITTVDNELQYLSLVTHQSLKVGLLFIKDLKLNDIETLNNLINSLMAEPNLENPEEVNGPPIDTVVELLVFIYKYVERFTLNNNEEVRALEALLEKDLFQSLYELLINEVIDLIFPEDSYKNEVNINTYLKRVLVDEYNSIVGVMELIDLLGLKFMQTMIITNGSIIETILNTDFAEENVEELISSIINILTDFEVYNEALNNCLTIAALEDILSVLIIPIMIQNEYYLWENALEIEADLKSIIPSVSQLLKNVLVLENDIIKTLNTFEMDLYFNVAIEQGEPFMYGVIFSLINFLDEVLTDDNKLLIDSSVELLINDILSKQIVLELLETYSEDFSLIDLEIMRIKNSLYSNIPKLASYDYENLEIEEEIAIIYFAQNLGIFSYLEMLQETNEQSMARSIPLELGTEKDEIYRKGHLIFSFTTEERGFYEILVAHEYRSLDVTVKDSTFEYVHSYTVMTNQSNNSHCPFLEGSETYYIVVKTSSNTFYEDIKIRVEQQAVKDLIIETPISYSANHDFITCEFRPTESNGYVFNLSSNKAYSGYIDIKDENNEVIYRNFTHANNENDYNYYFYLPADQLIYIHLESPHMYDVDLNIKIVLIEHEEFNGEEVIVNASFNKKLFYYVAPETGYYDLKLEGVTYSRFNLKYDKEYNNLSGFISCSIESGEAKIISLFLEASTVLLLEIEADMESYIFGMQINKVDENSLTVLEIDQPINEIIYNSSIIDYKFAIEKVGLYQLNLKTSTAFLFLLVIYDNEGNKVKNIFRDNIGLETYSFELHLSPGEYFLDVVINNGIYRESHYIVIGLEYVIPDEVILNEPLEIILNSEEISKISIVLFTPLEEGNYAFSCTAENPEASWQVFIEDIEGLSYSRQILSKQTGGYGESYLKAHQTYCLLVMTNQENIFNMTVAKIE